MTDPIITDAIPCPSGKTIMHPLVQQIVDRCGKGVDICFSTRYNIYIYCQTKDGCIMDYMKMAEELLDVRTKMVQIPYTQMISRLERGEIFVLNYLVTHEGPIHPKDLSNAMAVSTARIATLLNKLEDKKEVQRHVDPDDKRQLFVVLTDKGRERILQNREETLPSICDFLESLGPEDAAAYIRIEQKLWRMYTENKVL